MWQPRLRRRWPRLWLRRRWSRLWLWRRWPRCGGGAGLGCGCGGVGLGCGGGAGLGCGCGGVGLGCGGGVGTTSRATPTLPVWGGAALRMSSKQRRNNSLCLSVSVFQASLYGVGGNERLVGWRKHPSANPVAGLVNVRPVGDGVRMVAGEQMEDDHC